MSAYTVLDAVTLTPTELANLAAVGMTGEDGTGVLQSVKMDLDMIQTKLARITANIGAGANLTAIQAYVTAALT